MEIVDRALPIAGAATVPEQDTAAGMLGLPGFRVLASAECEGELRVRVETTEDLVGFPSCAAVGVLHDRACAWCGTCPPVGARCCCAGRSEYGAAGTSSAAR